MSGDPVMEALVRRYLAERRLLGFELVGPTTELMRFARYADARGHRGPLADPRRILQVRKDLHLGQTVRFMDWRDAQMRLGTVVAMKDTQLTIQERATRNAWTVPYTAVEPPAPGAPRPAPEPAPPPAPRAGRNDFRCGEKVAFEDKHLNTVVGVIVRINQRTASIDPGDGTTWRVGFSLLRHVVDI